MDAQGPEKARPYMEAAAATFPCVVDGENVLGQVFSCKAIPNAVFVDEEGVVRYIKRGGFDIRKPELAHLLEAWVVGPSPQELAQAGDEEGILNPEALQHFRQGLDLYRDGKAQEAVAEWRKGMALEPDNFIIRKQIWAVENPERFYQGKVDYDWQREQLSRGL